MIKFLRKSCLSIALASLGGVALAQPYDVTLSEACTTATGGDITLNFPGTPPNAISDGTLTLSYYGDLDGTGSNLEQITFIGESSSSIGTSNSIAQCTGTGTTVITIPMADIITWASSGSSIDIIADANSNVQPLTGSCNGNSFCVTAHLTYDVSSGPNDAGVLSLDTPIVPACMDTHNVVVTIANFGTNQINPVTVNWSWDGTVQTPVTVTDTLDTLGGSGLQTAQVNLGSIYLNSAAELKVWTSNPNSVADTFNLNDTMSMTLAPALAGLYVIGSSSSADYGTFNEAVDALVAYGICSSVIFDVENGTYDEQVVLVPINGASSSNTITFRSQNQDSTLVTLTTAANASGTNYTVQFNDADYFRFEQMTISCTTNTSGYYGCVLDFANGADWNVVRNCHLTNDYSGTDSDAPIIYSYTGICENNAFEHNLIENGSYGTYWYGSSTTDLGDGNSFIGNTFLNQYYYGSRLYYQNALVYKDNTMTSNATYTSGYGMYFGYCDNSVIESNHLYTSQGSSWPYYGMYVYYCDGSGLNNMGRIYNNLIVLGSASGSTSSYYGLYQYYSDFQTLANNTVVIRSGSSSSRAYYPYYPDIYRTFNNNFVNYSDGYAAYYYYGFPLEVENNNYYSPSGEFMYHDGTAIADLATWQQTTGFDLNGVSADPMFVDTIGGIHCSDSLNNAGMPVSFVTDDLYGKPRNPYTPDIGMYEYFLPANFSLGGDSIICGDMYELTINDPVQQILWTVNGNNTSGSSYTFQATDVPQVFNISVSVLTQYCGASIDAAQYTLVPNAHLDSNTHFCADENLMLQAGGGSSATYVWTPGGSTSQTLSVSSPGTYSVTKTEMGCVSSATTIATQSTAVDILDVEPCDSELPISLDATIPDGISYAWNGGTNVNSAVNMFNDEGSYSVTATDSYGCVSDDQFTINVIGVPTAAITESHYANYYLFSSTGSLDVGNDADYLWDFGDGDTSHAANPSHAYVWSGLGGAATYTVSLSITNPCGSHTTTFDVAPDPLGVQEVKGSQSFVVFPNPAKDAFTIRLSQPASVQVELIDLSGRIVAQQRQSTTTVVQMNLDGVASGTYLVKVISEGVASYTNIVVE